jgi:catechol 2,3-dioxygenase-like lactoylglutathione lyase family enzyme
MAMTFQVTIDCADPDRLAKFWAAALGYQLQPPPEGFDTWIDFLKTRGVPESLWNSASAIVDPAGAGPRIFFQQVPEPKSVKNRVHLDVNVGGGLDAAPDQRRGRVAAATDHLLGLGARKVGELDERGEHWVIMQDPEGNEFCLQ